MSSPLAGVPVHLIIILLSYVTFVLSIVIVPPGTRGTAYTLITGKDKEFCPLLVRNLEGANQEVSAISLLPITLPPLFSHSSLIVPLMHTPLLCPSLSSLFSWDSLFHPIFS